MLNAQHISLRFGRHTIVEDVSFSIQEGEFVALIGANGAGKSSVLKMISGAYKPSSGKVLLFNKALSRYTNAALAQNRAVLSQQYQVGFAMPAIELVEMGRMPYTETRAQSRLIAEEAMQYTQTHHLKNRLLHTLSGGEQQGVQLARVLAQIWEAREQPRLLLLDEPTSSLDISQQSAMLQIVQAFCKRGVAVLAVIHDLNLAAQFADRMLMMKAGKLYAEGRPQEILTQEKLRAVFGQNLSLIQHPHSHQPIIIPTTHTSYAYHDIIS